LRLTQPLVALTEATARMTRGDLSVRVDVPRSTELGALAESFNAMAGKVEGTVAALRRFAADAAHELHTPLSAMKTNLELTHERPDESRLAEAVAQIARLEALADDLLDLSRLEVAEPAMHEHVDVGILVAEVSEVYASRAEQAGVEFDLMVSDALPLVRGSASLLSRALSNLLDNAVKFTPSGGDVSLAARTREGTLELVVEDTGIGIPSEDLSALFSRFHRGSNTSGYPGSGLGLAIVKAIADVHLGTVRAENTSQGARFVFRLPLAAKP
jgi:signal transduction histidine kinase